MPLNPSRHSAAASNASTTCLAARSDRPPVARGFVSPSTSLSCSSRSPPRVEPPNSFVVVVQAAGVEIRRVPRGFHADRGARAEPAGRGPAAAAVPRDVTRVGTRVGPWRGTPVVAAALAGASARSPSRARPNAGSRCSRGHPIARRAPESRGGEEEERPSRVRPSGAPTTGCLRRASRGRNGRNGRRRRRDRDGRLVVVDGDDGKVRGKLSRRGVVADHPTPPDAAPLEGLVRGCRRGCRPGCRRSALPGIVVVGGVVGRRLAHHAVVGVQRRAERADERVVVRLDGAVIVEADDVAIAEELRGGADPGQAAIARVSRDGVARVARRGARGDDAGAVDRCVAAVASGRISDRGDAPRAREEREREAEADACASRRARSNRERAARRRPASPRAPRLRHRRNGTNQSIVRSSRRLASIRALVQPLGRVYG